jgi:hypothetical protein
MELLRQFRYRDRLRTLPLNLVVSLTRHLIRNGELYPDTQLLLRRLGWLFALRCRQPPVRRQALSLCRRALQLSDPATTAAVHFLTRNLSSQLSNAFDDLTNSSTPLSPTD